MATAASILAAPFLGLAGAFFADRFLGLAIVAGLVGGFALLAVLFAPYYRKSGAVTLPDFLAVRFGNPLVRFVGVDHSRHRIAADSRRRNGESPAASPD